MITARSLGTYLYLVTTGANISADDLSDFFPEGRKAFLKSLKELRDLGLIETKRAVINGKYVTYSEIVDIDFGSPKMELLSQQNMQNSILNIIAYLAKKQTESTRDTSEDFTNVIKIGRTVDFYEEDIAEERRKDQVRKHKEKIEMKQKRHDEQRMQRRNPNNTSAWSPTDIGFEFAERVFNLMHIKPWQVTRSRFIYALADKRKEYGTTGDIEKIMIDLYFMQISHDKSLTDPEIVWKRFILQFGNLLVEAKRTMVTPDEIETIKEESQSGREWLRNV